MAAFAPMHQRRLGFRCREDGEEEADALRKQLADLVGLDYRAYYPPPKRQVKPRHNVIALTDVRAALDEDDDGTSIFDLSEAASRFDSRTFDDADHWPESSEDEQDHHREESTAKRMPASREARNKPPESPLLDPVLKPKRKPRTLPRLLPDKYEPPRLQTALFGAPDNIAIDCPLYSWPQPSPLVKE